jgi:hypothetical protein
VTPSPAKKGESTLKTLQAIHCEDGYSIPPEGVFAPGWYVNGFPKAGTHLITGMLRPFAFPMPPAKFRPESWTGSFRHFGWSNEWLPVQQITWGLCGIRPGYFLKGHCGHTPELARVIYMAGIAKVFVYRDLRDVAVSQVHHILNDDPKVKHPDKEAYKWLGGFDEVLAAVIAGLDVPDGTYGPVYYPGVVERWELYAPWMDEEWVCSVCYADARLHPFETARRIAEYGTQRLARIFNVDISPGAKAFDEVAAAMVGGAAPEKSQTFRRGVTGEWKERFTEKHKDLFKKYDKAGWLVRLGFEQNDNW